jgi:hypothetical protein
MTQKINEGFAALPVSARSKADEKANLLCRRWHRLCEGYLPVKTENSVWRYSRKSKKSDASQGWKLHISATILEACDLFEKVAPFLVSQDVQFKAPESLEELSKINCGLQYGYAQVGKFITVYPVSEKQAVRLARRLHELTREFVSISVPFDEQYLPNSSVFYRYGGFASIEMTDKRGRAVLAVKSPTGGLIPDDRFQAVPEWICDPFQNNGKSVESLSTPAETPLTNTYKVFRAITQRGKGGTYQALDFSNGLPRFCVVKEGRIHGEVGWNGQDGYSLVKNEFDVLSALGKVCQNVPQVFSSFELNENFYLVMEYVEGKSLHHLMKPRRRRFSIKQVVKFAVKIAEIIREIHQSGWIWNDCKPANLIVTRGKKLKPVDFEGAYPVNQSAPFDWKTQGFSKSPNGQSSTDLNGKSEDIYALGAVIYFLLTGKTYDAKAPVEIAKLRRNVPPALREIIQNLLSDSVSEISEIMNKFKEIQNLL